MSIKLSPGGRTDEGRNEISMRALKKISNSEMNDKNKERAKIAKANMRRVAVCSASVAYFAAPATNAALGFPSACPSTSPMPFRCHSSPPFSVDISNLPRAGKATNKYSVHPQICVCAPCVCECVCLCALRTETETASELVFSLCVLVYLLK